MQLAEPRWLLMLVFMVVPWLAWRRRPRLAWPGVEAMSEQAGLKRRLRIAPWIWESLAIGCLALCLAQPRTVIGQSRIPIKGVAIVIALDRSSSMTRIDAGKNGATSTSRLAAAVQTVEAFIQGRPDDLIGLIVFAGLPERRSTPTVDHRHLIGAVRAVLPAPPAEDGTNLGDAVVAAVHDLIQESPKQKVLILVSDGRNEPGVAGAMDPLEAASLARSLGVTVHTIGLGEPATGSNEESETQGRNTPQPGQHDGPDVALLRAMAQRGGGQSFLAGDAGALAEAFHAIDALERAPVRGEVQTRYQSWSDVASAVALGILGLACLSRTLGGPHLP